ncbi:MAG: DNA translocase FtsK 4TM domain-containing protein, partial [Planctomycetaceae bacterium]|nr:DNA translocase FtsK 4TM domain-containing protein [Planctomycetaceae bacterium]
RNIGGDAGAFTTHVLREFLGLGAYVLPAFMTVWSLRLFSREGQRDSLLRLSGSVMVLTTMAVALHGQPLPSYAASPPVGNGGYVGAWGAVLLQERLQPPGVWIILASMLLAGLVLSNELRFVRAAFWFCLTPLTIWDRLAFRPTKTMETVETTGAPIDVPTAIAVASTPEVPPIPLVEVTAATAVRAVAIDEDDEPLVSEIRTPIKVNPPASYKPPATTPAPTSVAVVPKAPVRVAPPAVMVEITPPPFALPAEQMLDDAEEFPYELLAQKAQQAAIVLERTFKEFGLNVKVVEIDTGPVITQFELELEAGLRLSKVTALADDLAIALRVPSVRVVAPIPGKNSVGVEVPNDVRVMVRLKELLQNCRADFESKRIPLFIGKDVSGKPMVVDMAKMPHLLIAGRTGTGKSVCLNTLILSILMTRSPQQVKMLMIDPKMVELSPYMRIPHLMHPVITDMKKAEAVLGWAVDKMEERYDLLARVGVRHLDNYNKLGKEKILDKLDIEPDSDEADLIPDTMPYIVIIADEMADMMMTSGKDVEAHIIRLAQKSRAVGIHLVLATQKPTVDVITGLIKSNLPARIAFQVSSRVDSRVVLDEGGADKLLGNGDMLYLAPGTSNLNRAQGTFVSDDEVNRIIEFYSDQPPQYDAEIAQVTTAAKAAGKASNEPRERDDLYDQAVEVIIREGRGSVSLLQRALGVGYGRGARMIDWMAEDGVVGGFNGSQAREVIMTLDQWEETRASMR